MKLSSQRLPDRRKFNLVPHDIRDTLCYELALTDNLHLVKLEDPLQVRQADGKILEETRVGDQEV